MKHKYEEEKQSEISFIFFVVVWLIWGVGGKGGVAFFYSFFPLVTENFLGISLIVFAFCESYILKRLHFVCVYLMMHCVFDLVCVPLV